MKALSAVTPRKNGPEQEFSALSPATTTLTISAIVTTRKEL
ncbi:hypothetical protein [Erwinia phyllosphaerae]|nr:hypothetical protein [Erwinia phyllosphaerae]